MYGQNTTGSVALSQLGSRIFKIEYKGVINPADKMSSSEIVRESSQSSVVPLNRMNEEMQRICRMGGQIVSVTPLAKD